MKLQPLCFMLGLAFISSCDCQKPVVQVQREPKIVLGSNFYPVELSKKSSILFGESEVTVQAFCNFLNDAHYKTAPLSMKGLQIGEHDQAKLEITAFDHHKLKNVYLIEHAQSNIVRDADTFGPASPSVANESANCVTFFGAEAYCHWLSAKTQVSARLPTEIEWHACALGLVSAGAPLRGCPGDVWEWCSDWYDPEHKFKFCDEYRSPVDVPYPKKVVRGGQYRNRGAATVSDRAGLLLLGGGAGEQPTGFRLVIESTPDGTGKHDK